MSSIRLIASVFLIVSLPACADVASENDSEVVDGRGLMTDASTRDEYPGCHCGWNAPS